MRYLILLIIFFLSIISVDAQEINLASDWKIMVGDNLDWAKSGFNDGQWKTIAKAGPFEDNGYGDFEGFGWARKKVVIPSSLKKAAEKAGYMTLLLGKIDDVDETYFNGISLGKTGDFPPNYVTRYNELRIYKLNLKDVQWDKENTIAVRIYDGLGNGGFTGAPNFYKILVPSDLTFKPANAVEGNPLSNGNRAWKASSVIPGKLKTKANEMNGVSILLPVPGTINVFLNGKNLGKSSVSGNHKIFANQEYIKWDQVNEFVVYVSEEVPKEELIFLTPEFGDVKWYDVITIKPEAGNIIDPAKVKVTIENPLLPKIAGNLVVEIVSDINAIQETKVENIIVSKGETKTISPAFNPNFKGIGQINYTFINSATGEKIVGNLWKGEIK